MSNTKDTPMDYKQLDDFLQTYLPDDYYEDIRAKIVPALKTLLDEHKTELYWRSQFTFLQRDYSELDQKSEALKLELQKQKQEIANHIAVNSLLIDSEGEADLANKLYQCQGELQKQKELKAELVNALKVITKERSFRGGFPHTTNVFESLIKKSNEI